MHTLDDISACSTTGTVRVLEGSTGGEIPNITTSEYNNKYWLLFPLITATHLPFAVTFLLKSLLSLIQAAHSSLNS